MFRNYWENRAVPWDNPTAVESTIAWQWDSQAIEVAPYLKHVQPFQRRAHLVGKDTALHVLDVSKPGSPTPVATISSHNSWEIAVSGDASIFAAGATTILRCGIDGSSTAVATLEELNASRFQDLLVRGRIYGIVGCSPKGSVLFFEFSVEKPTRRFFVCRLDLATKHGKVLESSSILDLDVDAGVVFTRDPSAKRIHVRDFDGSVERSYRLSRYYSDGELSPDKKKLLISESVFSEEPAMAILDLATSKETLLSIQGSHAVWGPENWIYFVRGETQLWRYDLKNRKLEGLMRVIGRKTSRDGSFAKAPVLSPDKSLVCWTWAIKGVSPPGTIVFGDYTRLGMILIDLENNEFRTVDQYWRDVKWIRE